MRKTILSLAAFAFIAAIHSSCMPSDPSMIRQTAAVRTMVDEENKITEYELSNGLRVVVKEDHRAPLVISQLWYKVGSSDEHSGITGISHALEHMMFKGTDRYSEEEFTEALRRIGARNNAFTGSDYTGYYQKMEKSHWPLSLELESDRMINLKLREEDFRKEIEVVKEERRLRTDDKPVSKAYEQLYASAFNNAPYGHPVIGWMEDLNHITLEDLQLWYERWYMPNNAVLVVAGDVQPDEVYALAERSMGNIPARKLRPNKPRGETAQTGERRIVMELENAKKPYLMMGYKVPNAGPSYNGGKTDSKHEAWEPFALDMLARVLSQGANSRFQKNVIRGRQIAVSASAGYSLYRRYPDLFLISGTPNLDHTLEQLEAALEEEIELVKTDLVDEESLQTIKSRGVMTEVFSQDSLMHQAYRIGSMEVTGVGWQEIAKYPDRMGAVTAEQVRAVAKRYLNKESRTVVRLLPAAKTDSEE